MNRYRVVYYWNSIIAEWYIRAHDEAEVVKLFRNMKGNHRIKYIEEAEEGYQARRDSVNH